tara:strand:- start:752 stop:1171 length:420 start_codon:yes stop_codon:yes gene_type:complete
MKERQYLCVIRKVVDGDTVDVDIDLGFNTWIMNERIRLHGVDCPESRTSDESERPYGKAAKEFVQDFLPLGSRVVIKTVKAKGKYGRVLGDFQHYKDEQWLCRELVKNYHAVPYFGQNKTIIAESHLVNRKRLAALETK